MNNVLELRGKRFVQASRTGNFGGPSMNGKEIVTSNKINRLVKKIIQIKQFWQKENKPFEGILISVHYNKIVAKSNRVGGIFKGNKSNDSVVGAKFNDDRRQLPYFGSGSSAPYYSQFPEPIARCSLDYNIGLTLYSIDGIFSHT